MIGSRLLVRAVAAVSFSVTVAGCGGGGTVTSPAPLPASGGGGAAAPAPGASPIIAASASPAPSAAASAPAPAGSAAAVDRTCDVAPYPSAQWTQCEAQNYAKTSQAPAEQSAPGFATALATQSMANTAEWTARAAADPSWLGAPSGNTPQTPLCTTWGSMCVGDPFQYPDVNGPDGSAFFTNEATVVPFVIYDDGCARLSGRVWAPKSSAPGSRLPNVVIENGSIQAPETLYRWAALALVRDGYVVLTFDPRGQGRSDEQTPSGVQGGNANVSVFYSDLVDTIDFFRSTPANPYPWNVTCKGTYPTAVTAYDPFYDRIDRDRLGIAGHSAGAVGVSIVQGFGGAGAAPWPGKIDATNPVKAAVAWDGLRSPAGGNVGGIGNGTGGTNPAYAARVPSLGQSSEYGLTPQPFAQPPDPELHKAGYRGWVSAGVPVFEMTIQGSTHYEWSLISGFPATSWCPSTTGNVCAPGYANPSESYYTVAWFDRWLKAPGEPGYGDADARLLDDAGPQGRVKFSYRFRSARNFPDRSGATHHCEDIRAGCTDTTTSAARRR